jgi:hypothetical protein
MSDQGTEVAATFLLMLLIGPLILVGTVARFLADHLSREAPR